MTVRTPVNPWSWSAGFGYEQANLVEGATRILVCAGQTSVDADGAPVHLDDMGKQLAQALDNLEAVLVQAGMSLADVARLNFFTTDLDAFFGAYEVVMARLPGAGSARPARSSRCRGWPCRACSSSWRRPRTPEVRVPSPGEGSARLRR